MSQELREKDNKKTLSIITINFNNKNGLVLTANSVINQTYKDFEWIVIDGGSTDGSVDVIQENSDKITYWVSEKDKGIYNAMNKGISHASGEYLLFLNSGDFLYDHNTIKKTQDYLNGYDLCVGNIVTEKTKIKSSLPNKIINKEEFAEMLFFKCVPHPATFIKKTIFDKYGLYNENYRVIGDWDFFFRTCFIHNVSVHTIPLYVSVYDTHGVSSAPSPMSIKDVTYFETNWPGLKYLQNFYTSNYDILKVVKGSKVLMILVRIWMKLFNNFK